MGKGRFSNVFETDADTYWGKVFFDPDYNRRLYLEGLGFKSYELIELTGEAGGSRTRKIRIEPKNEAPAVVQKLVGDSLSYVETARFDADKRLWSYTVATSKMADKISIGGTLWVEPAGERRITRFSEVDIRVSIFGVGGVVEGFIEKTTRENLDRTAAFTNAFIREKGY